MQTGKMIFEEDGKEVCYHVHLLFGNVFFFYFENFKHEECKIIFEVSHEEKA